jgi:hypothetical protein
MLMKEGGVCIYVRHDLSYSKIDLSNFYIDQHIEVSAILLSTELLVVILLLLKIN